MSDTEFHQGDEPDAGGHSRRRFLAGAGAGLAVTAVGVAVAGEASAATESGAGVAAAQTAAVAAGQPLVAYVADANRDRVSIQRGGTEVVIRDAALVKALNNAFKRRHAGKES